VQQLDQKKANDPKARKSERRSNVSGNGTGLAIGDTLGDICARARAEGAGRNGGNLGEMMIKIHYRRAIVYRTYIT